MTAVHLIAHGFVRGTPLIFENGRWQRTDGLWDAVVSKRLSDNIFECINSGSIEYPFGELTPGEVRKTSGGQYIGKAVSPNQLLLDGRGRRDNNDLVTTTVTNTVTTITETVGYSGRLPVMSQFDPKTGLMQHSLLTFSNGLLKSVADGPWHPYQEYIDNSVTPVEPCAGTTVTGAITYRHLSNALTWLAGAEAQQLEPNILGELSVSAPTSAIIAVQPNVSNLWYGTVLPIRFINTETSGTPRKWVVQLRNPTGVPAGANISFGLTNKDNPEDNFLIDTPFAIESAWDAEVIGYGGEVVVYLYLGLGFQTNSELYTPPKQAYTLQVDAWLV